MAIDDSLPLDDKAKRTRDLLASFYSQDPSSVASAALSSPAKVATLDSINSSSFDPDVYMKLLVKKSNLEGLLHKHVQMAAEIKNLDTDLQMLVYENYNKFISATDTIKRMKTNIVGMEANMGQLLNKITSVQSKSDSVNSSLFEKREHIEKLHRTRNLLRKVQFIYDLPVRLNKCIKAEAYTDAVRFFTGAKPIFEAYGDSSFQDCKRASEEAMELVKQNLQEKLYSDNEPIEARAEAVVLLKQLNFPVENLKAKLLKKLENYLVKFQKESNVLDLNDSKPSGIDRLSGSSYAGSPNANEDLVSIGVFSKTVRAYLIIFPDSEGRLIKIAQDLFSKRYETVQQQIEKNISSMDLLTMLRGIWEDVTVMDEVLSEAALPVYSLEAVTAIIKQYISGAFSHLLVEISESLKVPSEHKGGLQDSPLQIALESSKKCVIQGSMDLLLEFRQLLTDDLELVKKLRDLMIDRVQEGFHSFFQKLNQQFHLLCGKSNTTYQDTNTSPMHIEKVHTGLVLVLAQLSVFIEQTAIPRITEEIAASFSAGGSRGHENGPAFAPGEVCRLFHSSGDKFLHLYINLRTQKISAILKKRFTTPNWIKHREPREVHMFVDLLIQELEGTKSEVKQILPHGAIRRHRRSDSAGSTTSSRSNPLREDKLHRSNTQRARSQLLKATLQIVWYYNFINWNASSIVFAGVGDINCCKALCEELARVCTPPNI